METHAHFIRLTEEFLSYDSAAKHNRNSSPIVFQFGVVGSAFQKSLVTLFDFWSLGGLRVYEQTIHCNVSSDRSGLLSLFHTHISGDSRRLFYRLHLYGNHGLLLF